MDLRFAWDGQTVQQQVLVKAANQRDAVFLRVVQYTPVDWGQVFKTPLIAGGEIAPGRAGARAWQQAIKQQIDVRVSVAAPREGFRLWEQAPEAIGAFQLPPVGLPVELRGGLRKRGGSLLASGVGRGKWSA